VVRSTGTRRSRYVFQAGVVNAGCLWQLAWRATRQEGMRLDYHRRDLGALVGTLWSVRDSPARTCTERLYTALPKGATLSQASIAGREAARSAGDATWLAYVVYGRPHMRISKS
jgi:hypothetical protein